MNGTPGMYLHVYKCSECNAYGTQDCVWENTKENNIACEKFEYKVPTTSSTGTTPISGFCLDLPTTMTSSCGPIIITESSTINTEEI